jgi:hypothetical protein
VAAVGLALTALLVQAKRKSADLKYERIAQVAAGLPTLIGIGQLLADSSTANVQAAAALLLYPALYFAFAWLRSLLSVVFLATAMAAAAAWYLQEFLGISNWYMGLTLLALLLIGAGYHPFFRKKRKWSMAFRVSSLVLSAVTTLLLFLFHGPVLVVFAAVFATLFALEAWQQDRVELAVLADLIYIQAYFFILWALNVQELQYFTTGAAVLGIGMHYILRRMDEPRVTFLAGMASQLVLLGASFFQMLSMENLNYFFILFFQALAVIAYGTVIRSRSLVLVPVVFVVLGVTSIVIKAFSDFLLLIVIACSGLVLLSLGISALFLRESIGEAGRRFRESLMDWSA